MKKCHIDTDKMSALPLIKDWGGTARLNRALLHFFVPTICNLGGSRLQHRKRATNIRLINWKDCVWKHVAEREFDSSGVASNLVLCHATKLNFVSSVSVQGTRRTISNLSATWYYKYGFGSQRQIWSLSGSFL